MKFVERKNLKLLRNDQIQTKITIIIIMIIIINIIILLLLIKNHNFNIDANNKNFNVSFCSCNIYQIFCFQCHRKGSHHLQSQKTHGYQPLDSQRKLLAYPRVSYRNTLASYPIVALEMFYK